MATNSVAFLWDESFLWGLMAYKALKHNSLPFDLIRSEDIRNGCLKNYKMLFVPGGWASNKIKTLGDKGIDEIRQFVKAGGNYLGFCGGAGLATFDGIGLLNIKRVLTRQRVPSFSGRIRLARSDHAIWAGALDNIYNAWWPSQFLIDDENITVLATYGEALPDSFSSDLNVGDIQKNGNWTDMETLYRINLNPRRLFNEPAVVEGPYGKGNVVLSLIHFDTPGDMNGAVVLKNLWDYLFSSTSDVLVKKDGTPGAAHCSEGIISELDTAVSEIIALGQRSFLWFWRKPMLLQWRRGVRGLEYCTLYVLIREIALLANEDPGAVSQLGDKLASIKNTLLPFAERAKELLIMERFAMQNGHITYEKCDDPVINEIRNELFSTSKSYGGVFKKLLDDVDDLLYLLLSEENA